ncbi:uncharacterized protein [Aegilops tauschii subsp. strangulata]|uniref:uncharacterized protein n=1 Tax=Aegilops tauschii subsp. strangulata TaxID=200361 RepID=UPI003CC8DB9D
MAGHLLPPLRPHATFSHRHVYPPAQPYSSQITARRRPIPPSPRDSAAPPRLHARRCRPTPPSSSDAAAPPRDSGGSPGRKPQYVTFVCRYPLKNGIAAGQLRLMR